MECQEGREGLWTGRFKQRKDKQHTAPHKMPRGKTLHHGRVKTQTRTPREEHQRKKHTSCVQNSIQKDSPRSTKEHLKQKPETHERKWPQHSHSWLGDLACSPCLCWGTCTVPWRAWFHPCSSRVTSFQIGFSLLYLRKGRLWPPTDEIKGCHNMSQHVTISRRVCKAYFGCHIDELDLGGKLLGPKDRWAASSFANAFSIELAPASCMQYMCNVYINHYQHIIYIYTVYILFMHIL